LIQVLFLLLSEFKTLFLELTFDVLLRFCDGLVLGNNGGITLVDLSLELLDLACELLLLILLLLGRLVKLLLAGGKLLLLSLDGGRDLRVDLGLKLVLDDLRLGSNTLGNEAVCLRSLEIIHC
jgi:hypothetical protein